jgi:protein-disulfide isomerase
VDEAASAAATAAAAGSTSVPHRARTGGFRSDAANPDAHDDLMRDNAGIIAAIVLALGGLLVMLFVGAGAVVYLRMRATAKAMPPTITTPLDAGAGWSDSDSPVPVTSDDPMRGDRNALVTIVSFEDFEDPYCARIEATFSDIDKKYSDADVRFVWKNEPLAFHSHARGAAEAARGVFELGGSTAFWTFHDRAFASGAYALGASNYDVWAGEAGVSSHDLDSGLAKGLYASRIDDDVKLAASVGATATPTTFINGRIVVGAQPLVSFTTVIDGELVKARKRVASGTPLDRIYVTLSKENFGTPALTGGSGTKTIDTVTGSGAVAVIGDRLVVHYVGTLDDGTVFDSSRSRGAPFDFELGHGTVIKGWETGLVGMRVGGKRKLVIPPAEAYGTRGVPPKIPPNATLTFDIELLAIK